MRQLTRHLPRSLQHGPYRRLFLAYLLSEFASMATWLALPLYAYHLSGSVTMLASMSMAFGTARIIGGVYGGVVADRFDRKRVMVVCDTAMAAAVCGLVLADGTARLWIVPVVAVVIGLLEASYVPARQAVLAGVVPDEELAGMVATDGLVVNMSALLAPLFGTAVFVAFGVVPIIVFDAASYLVSVGLVMSVHMPTKGTVEGPAGARTGSALVRHLRDLGDGIRVVAGNRFLRWSTVATVFGSAAGGVCNVAFIVWITRTLGQPATFLGTIIVAISAGAILGGIVLGRLGGNLHHRTLFQIATPIGLLMFPALALATSPLLALFASFVIGLYNSAAGVIVQTRLYRETVDESRARAMSLRGTAGAVGSILGASLAGVWATSVGQDSLMWVSAATMTLGAIPTCLAMPDLLPRLAPRRRVVAPEARVATSTAEH